MAKVIVVDYDPSWPETFERLRTGVWRHVQDVATDIEHVGSTAVPGLAAKPIVDMTIVVPTASAMRTVLDQLAPLRYRHRGDLAVPGREAFDRPVGTEAHHLYACVAGCDALRNHLALRDHLRRDGSAARAYGVLKKRLAERFADDIDGYIEGKTEFIVSILSCMGFTAGQLEGIKAANSKS